MVATIAANKIKLCRLLLPSLTALKGLYIAVNGITVAEKGQNYG